MRKRDELTHPSSCMSRALDNEMVFVLIARDPAAPAAIQAWIDARIDMGLNAPDDAKIRDAAHCIYVMNQQRLYDPLIAKK